jgi:hypothetical protein
VSGIARYTEIKTLLLAYYWRGCRDHGLSGWAPEQVCSWAYEEFDGSYDSPFEKLMLEVASLALTGGWHLRLVNYHMGEARQILSEIDLDTCMLDLSSEDADDLLTDLKILGIV